MKSIEVVVSPSGETKIETRGFSGPECQQADEFLRKALGSSQCEALSPEYHSARSVQETNTSVRF